MQTLFLVAFIGVLVVCTIAGVLATLMTGASVLVLVLRWRCRPRLRRAQLVVTALLGVAGLALLIPVIWFSGWLGSDLVGLLTR